MRRWCVRSCYRRLVVDDETIVAILTEVRKGLKKRDSWVKGFVAVDAAGKEVVPTSPSATRFDLLGKIIAVSAGKYGLKTRADRRPICAAVGRHFPEPFAPEEFERFNDNVATEHKDVLAVLDAAIGSFV